MFKTQLGKQCMKLMTSAPFVVGAGMVFIVFGGLSWAPACVHVIHNDLKVTGSEWLGGPISIAEDTLPPLTRYPVQMMAEATPSAPTVIMPQSSVPLKDDDFTPRRDPFAPLVPPINLPQNTNGRAKVIAPGDSMQARKAASKSNA